MSDMISDKNFNVGTPLFDQLALGSPEIDEKNRLIQITDILATAADGENSNIPGIPASKPQLAKPAASRDTSGVGLTKIVKGFSTLLQQLQSSAENLISPTKANKELSDSTQFHAAVGEKIAQMSDQELAALVPGTSRQQAERQLTYAVSHPNDPHVPPLLKSGAAQLSQQVTEATGFTPSPLHREVEDLFTANGYSSLIAVSLDQLGLSPSAKLQLEFANQVPSAASKLPPKGQAILKEVQSAAFHELQETMGVPNGWQSTQEDPQVAESLNKQFGDKVSDNLYEQLNEGKLSQSQFHELHYLLAYPDAKTPNRQSLMPILQSVIGQTTSSQQKEWGFPSGYDLQAKSGSLDATLTGALVYNFKQGMDGIHNPPLSAGDRQLLLQALASESAVGSLPIALQGIFATLQKQAIGSVKAAYGLPSDWSPDVGALSKAIGVTPAAQLLLDKAHSLIDQGEEWVGGAEKLLTSMGGSLPGDMRGALMSFLAAVSIALSDLRQATYESASSNGNIGHILNRIQNEATTGRLQKQRAQLEETMAKQAKMATLGPLMQVLMWIVMLIMIVLTAGLAAGPLMAAQATATAAMGAGTAAATAGAGAAAEVGVATATVAATESATAAAEASITAALSALGSAMPEGIALSVNQAWSLIAVTSVSSAMTVMSTDLGSTGSGKKLGSLLTMFLESCKVPKKVANYINMATQIVAMAAMAVVALIAAPAGGAMLMGPAMQKIAAETLQKAAELLQKLVGPLLDMMERIGLESISKPIQEAIQNVIDKLTVYIEKQVSNAQKLVDAENKLVEHTKKIEGFQDELKNLGIDKSNYEELEKKLKAAYDLKTKDPSPANISAFNQAEHKLTMRGGLDNAISTEKKIHGEMTEAFQKLKNEINGNIELFSIVAQGFGEVAKAVPAMEQKIFSAQIERIKADMEVDKLKQQQFTKAMKKVIDKLINGMSQLVSMGGQIGQMQQDIWKNASQTMSAAAAAIQG